MTAPDDSIEGEYVDSNAPVQDAKRSGIADDPRALLALAVAEDYEAAFGSR